MSRTTRVGVMFDRFGPYHVARLRAAARLVDLVAVEVASASHEYAWDAVDDGGAFDRVTLFDTDSRSAQPHEIERRVSDALDRSRLDVVAVPGWSDPAALAALGWAARTRTPVLVMSESQARDAERSPFREAIKSHVLAGVGAALVGGAPHAAYATSLGIPARNIFAGYDAVDNDHFARGAEAARADAVSVRARLGLPAQYVLASCRFVPKKNLPRLIDAFARYRTEVEGGAWDLVLLGDGPEAAAVHAAVAEHGLGEAVQFPGFIQYDALPAYYGLAGAFVHPSTTEQWGLVVNEAMASGLPVIVSDRCGCAPDLVQDGVNGFTFDPEDTDALTSLLHRLLHVARREAMGAESRRIVAAWGPDRFATGLAQAARSALGASRRAPLRSRLVLRALAYR